MALSSTTAFVLRADALAEKDLVLSLLTCSGGVVRGVMRGGRSPRRKSPASTQLLTEVEVTLFEKEGSDLARVSDVVLVRSAFDLASRAETAPLLPYLAESLLAFVPEAEPGEEPYRLLRHVLDALQAGGSAPLVARYFEVWMLRLSGLLPRGGGCAGCGDALGEPVWFDPEIPGLVGPECRRPGGFLVPHPARELLEQIRRRPLTEMPPQEPEALDGVEALAREIRRRFLGHELKSYRFLRL